MLSEMQTALGYAPYICMAGEGGDNKPPNSLAKNNKMIRSPASLIDASYPTHLRHNYIETRSRWAQEPQVPAYELKRLIPS